MERREFLAASSLAFAGCLHTTETEEDPRELSEDLRARWFAGDSLVRLEEHGYTVAGADSSGSSVAVLSEETTDDGYPVLETACRASEDERPGILEVTPYDGVGDGTGGARLYAVPESGHPMLPSGVDPDEADPQASYRGAVFDEGTTVDSPGYVGRYRVVPGEGGFTRAVYDFGDEVERNGDPGGSRLTLSVWPTDHTGPDGEPEIDEALPDIELGYVDSEETVWYHEADASTEVYVEPERERVEPPTSLEFTTHLHTDRVLYGGPRLLLFKLVDGDWRRATWRLDPDTAKLVYPGVPDSNTLHLYAGEADEEGHGHVSLLSSGVYAFTPDYGRLLESPEPDTEEAGDWADVKRRFYAAAFEVEMDDVEPTVPDDADVSREDGTVTVETGGSSARFRVTREEEADELLTAELLYNYEHGLRYALPAFDEDVDEVVVETDESTAATATTPLSGREVRRVDYRGDAYEVTEQ